MLSKHSQADIAIPTTGMHGSRAGFAPPKELYPALRVVEKIQETSPE